MLEPHPSAALEYWFFKVNYGSMALLVDWIIRRKSNEKILRVSIHSPYKREVLFESLPSVMTDDKFLKTSHTKGTCGEVSWDLAIDLQNKWIVPDIFPNRLTKMTDIVLDSAPLARFSGWIRHGKEEMNFQNVAGMVSQYWGRGLAPEWWWLSVNQFEQAGYALEASVFRSRLWGLPLELPFAYLYLRQPEKESLSMLPFGLAQVTGNPEAFEATFRRIGAPPLRLVCTGRDYGDLGDNIINTLVGDMQVWEGDKLMAEARGTAGLERRKPWIHRANVK
jgi:hypothetical protein